jgi:hypothetical protein
VITGTQPPPLKGEYAPAYNPAQDSMLLYGGNATGWPYEQTTWVLTGSTWLSPTAAGPVVRYGAQMGYDGTQLILFGGSDENDSASNQTWGYDGSGWSQLTIGGTVPASRSYHSLAADPLSQTLYLFGGNDETGYYNDLWVYENETWTEIEVSGVKPPARTLSAMTYDSEHNRLLIFGGRAVTGTLLADLWAFDAASETWQLLADGGGGGPPPRLAHTLFHDAGMGRVVLVGGVTDDGDTLLNDVWHYDEGWTQVTDAPFSSLAYQQAVETPAGIMIFSDGEVWRYE